MPRMAQLSCEPLSQFNLHAAGPSSGLQLAFDCAHEFAESALSPNATRKRSLMRVGSHGPAATSRLTAKATASSDPGVPKERRSLDPAEEQQLTGSGMVGHCGRRAR